LKEQWHKWVEKIDALALRERALIFLMLSVVMLTPVKMFLLDPLRVKHASLTKQLAQKQAEIANLQSQVQGLAVNSQVDPDVESRKRLEQLKRRLSEMEAPLETVQQTLVSPDRKVVLLEGLLLQYPHLKMVSLKTLPATSALESKVAGGGRGGASLVYRHGVQLVLEGGYHDLLHYLAGVEKLPLRVVWSDADLKVDNYPQITLTLTLYTLSLEKVWLSV
jgi:MSHA biogenesis protein MshJ